MALIARVLVVIMIDDVNDCHSFCFISISGCRR